MKSQSLLPLGMLIFAAGLLTTFPSQSWSFQKIQIRKAIPAIRAIELQAVEEHEHVHKKEGQDKDKKKKDDGPITDTAKIKTDTPPLAKKFIRFHMWDGSIVGGEVTTDKIDVKTEFGTLEVPIESISQFFPGLNSIPSLNEKITKLVEGLGDKDFDVREKSHRELLAMGIQLRDQLDKFEDGGSVERKKHLAEIRKEIAELVDEMDEFDEPLSERALIRGDTVVTKDFSIVGKIVQGEFRLASKFGELSVNLGDIRMADRTMNEEPSEVRKSVDVDANDFFQTNPKSVKIRVNRGDKIAISASGVVQWTNWSTSSSPDGLSNQGQWQGMNCGTLAARIGNSTNYIKIGSKGEFTAKQSGVLYLGIAMRDNYASNSGYTWTGKYTAKVLVKPAGKE